MSEQELLDRLKGCVGPGVVCVEGSWMNIVVALRPDTMRPALEFFKHQGFNMLVDLTAVDYVRFGEKTKHPNPASEGARFKLTYRLMKMDATQGLVESRIALQCRVEGEKGPASAKDLWPNADWLEREVWDMFGISFADRPGIARLLMYEEFVGHPLRKDYAIDKRQPLIAPKHEPERDRMLKSDLRPKVT